MSVVIVGGALANKPGYGGEAWVRMSWVRGLRRLGLEAYLVERIEPRVCSDTAGRAAPFTESRNLDWFRKVARRFELAEAAVLVCGQGEEVHGMSLPELRDLAAEADLLVNISGHLPLDGSAGTPLEGWLRPVRRKVYVDLDPGFTQFWHAAGDPGARVADHDLHFTVGENVGSSDCGIPTNGLRWRPIRQPVLLEDWPVVAPEEPDRLTTVASWRGSYGPVRHDGKRYGLKAHEFRKYLELPSLAPGRFEVALDIHPADRKDLEALRGHGWRVTDPKEVAGSADAFRSYIQRSGAEFSVAQGIYVETASGWFSDRSARYLASGRPTLLQDTGFSRNLPVGEGLVPFRTLREAAAGARRIARDYGAHARAARALAEEHFDARRVLGRFLEEVEAAA